MLKITNPGQFSKQVRDIVRNKIVRGRLTEINGLLRTNVNHETNKFKGVRANGLSSLDSVQSYMGRRDMIVRVFPHSGQRLVFERNVYGSTTAQYVMVPQAGELHDWVLQKYNGSDKGAILAGQVPLRVRGSSESGGIPPLGSVERSFFINAYERFKREDLDRLGIKLVTG